MSGMRRSIGAEGVEPPASAMLKQRSATELHACNRRYAARAIYHCSVETGKRVTSESGKTRCERSRGGNPQQRNSPAGRTDRAGNVPSANRAVTNDWCQSCQFR